MLTLPRRWSARSKRREMRTMAEHTDATIHVGVCSSVASDDMAEADDVDGDGGCSLAPDETDALLAVAEH